MKDITIYLKDLNDKEALKNAKQIIKDIYYLNSQKDYSSVFTLFFDTTKKEFEHFELDNVNKNVLTLSRKIK